VPEEYRDVVEPFLRNKPVRTLSGVAPVAVMTSPFDCPHGRCSYCPGGVPYNTPQSYTGREPAALRASMYGYDPYRQTRSRLEQLRAIGHRTDKVDLIIMGGTFTSRPEDYREWFVKRCFDAMNEVESEDLESAQTANETAKSRCVGLTVETRPDWFKQDQAEHSLGLGATKVELGVQILDDAILDGVKRGHHVKEVVDATRLAKDSGYKVAYHMMPGLPGSSREKDLASFRMMIEDDRFRPDMLKIYPTLVVKGTELYQQWLDGAYSPLSLEETVDLLRKVKKAMPPWIRILRIQRDIPSALIEAGVKKSHLRELVMAGLREEGAPCRCIRCREIGRSPSSRQTPDERDVELKEIVYKASGGAEHFLSFEIPSTDSLIGYARLRVPGKPGNAAALIRELHVYGQMVPISERSGEHWQHRGYGEGLLSECERRAVEYGLREVRVTSGVGARGYFRQLGYERKGPYMAKLARGH
ncbi:MAG: tRNA uridine(34) 5-carboxymethylaminomethyl modification radical SAM/GNAT enzyme Elp3, partial [Thermoplasmata archaeon]